MLKFPYNLYTPSNLKAPQRIDPTPRLSRELKSQLLNCERYTSTLQGATTLVFIPGLMEGRAGLCYLGQEMARFFPKRGVSVFLFDLAGQGDSTLLMTLEEWRRQLEEIVVFLHDQRVIFVGRGIGIYLPFLLKRSVDIVALSPPDLDRFRYPEMVPSPITPGHVMPSTCDKETWYSLGAEVECLGGLEVPAQFFPELQRLIPTLRARFKGFSRTYDAIKQIFPETFALRGRSVHPLFDKAVEREALWRDLLTYILLPAQRHLRGLIQSLVVGLPIMGVVLSLIQPPLSVIQPRELSIQPSWVPLSWKEYIRSTSMAP